LVLSPFLKTGIISADFKLSGNIPSRMQMFIIFANVGAITTAHIFRILIGGQLDLVDLLESISAIYFMMSFSVIGLMKRVLVKLLSPLKWFILLIEGGPILLAKFCPTVEKYLFKELATFVGLFEL
jgi:hypothetical protein